MNYKQRVKRLEKTIIGDVAWGVFSINYYENDFDRQEAQDRLVADHRHLTHRIFVMEVPGLTTNLCEERLLNMLF